MFFRFYVPKKIQQNKIQHNWPENKYAPYLVFASIFPCSERISAEFVPTPPWSVSPHSASTINLTPSCPEHNIT
jgi:hypothetical protein